MLQYWQTSSSSGQGVSVWKPEQRRDSCINACHAVKKGASEIVKPRYPCVRAPCLHNRPGSSCVLEPILCESVWLAGSSFRGSVQDLRTVQAQVESWCIDVHHHWLLECMFGEQGECSMLNVNDRRHILTQADSLSHSKGELRSSIISARASSPRETNFTSSLIKSIKGNNIAAGTIASANLVNQDTHFHSRMRIESATASIETTIFCTLQDGCNSFLTLLIRHSDLRKPPAPFEPTAVSS
jgi:hypothetical protein